MTIEQRFTIAEVADDLHSTLSYATAPPHSPLRYSVKVKKKR